MTIIQKTLRILLHGLLYLVIAGFLVTGLLRTGMLISGRSKTHLAPDVPPAPVALVLGAGLNRDGTPGVVLRDRVDTAVELYKSGSVEKLLMSGDNSSPFYNEPGAMYHYALSLGVPEEDIVLDYAGRRTYDSCYRARAIFGLEKLVVVTQAYHLPRALFLCNALGIEAYGVTADYSSYLRSRYTIWWLREILATINAYWDVFIIPPQPILGNPEPIFQ